MSMTPVKICWSCGKHSRPGAKCENCNVSLRDVPLTYPVSDTSLEVTGSVVTGDITLDTEPCLCDAPDLSKPECAACGGLTAPRASLLPAPVVSAATKAGSPAPAIPRPTTAAPISAPRATAPQATPFRAVIRSAAGELFPVGSGVLLGREEVCVPRGIAQFLARERGVSRRHVWVAQLGDEILLVDQDSRNGTWIDELRLPAFQLVRLHLDSLPAVVRLGSVVLLTIERGVSS